MSFQILIVCSANVCRSPMAAAVLGREITRAGLGTRIDVQTYGDNASPGSPMCQEMVSIAGSRSLGSETFAKHRSRSLRPATIERADLVLAADRAVRAGVIRMRPGVHAKTFTLRQAAELAEQVVKGKHGPVTEDPVAALSWFTTEMDSWRGLTDVPQIEMQRLARRPWKRVAVHAHDVPDAHTSDGLHPITADLLISASQRLASSLVAGARLGVPG